MASSTDKLFSPLTEIPFSVTSIRQSSVPIFVSRTRGTRTDWIMISIVDPVQELAETPRYCESSQLVHPSDREKELLPLCNQKLSAWYPRLGGLPFGPVKVNSTFPLKSSSAGSPGSCLTRFVVYVFMP
jgi:hypothetical protein